MKVIAAVLKNVYNFEMVSPWAGPLDQEELSLYDELLKNSLLRGVEDWKFVSTQYLSYDLEEPSVTFFFIFEHIPTHTKYGLRLKKTEDGSYWDSVLETEYLELKEVYEEDVTMYFPMEDSNF